MVALIEVPKVETLIRDGLHSGKCPAAKGEVASKTEDETRKSLKGRLKA